MINPAIILSYQQGNDVAPPPEGYEHITNPLNPLLRSANRLAHFTDGVYDLSAESHLMRLLKVLLGDAGVGGAQRAMMLVRLQQTLGGTHFFDLDAFYGGIFGVNRALGEHLAVDPQRDVVPASTWDQIKLSDASYRSRASRLSAAFQLGATIRGIEAVAEAMTGIEFDVIEHWMYPAYRANSWTSWESFTWDAMEAFSWDALEFSETGSTETPRNIVSLFPHEQLTPGERFDVERALDRVKPVAVLVNVVDVVTAAEVVDIPFFADSPSERWEVRQLVRNSRINGILPYPNDPENEFLEPSSSPWSNYSGEAWTVLDRNPRTLGYSTPVAISLTEQLDVTSVDMTPQPFRQVAGTSQSVSLPEYALKPVQGLFSGRSVSDGIIVTNPYGDRDAGQSGMLVDHVDADFMAGQMQSLARTGTRFWTTPIRNATDTTNDVLGIRFDEPVTVNHLSFDYARFPCTFNVQAWDRGLGAWVSLGEIRNQDSSPFGIGNEPPPDAVHAYHYGSDHWGQASLSFEGIIAQRWRIVGVRQRGIGPVGINGTAIPYPLGIRNLDMGYRINALNKVPNVSPVAPVNVGRNILGLQTQYYLHRARAAFVTDALPTAWICEPQPIRDAVVSMYVKFNSVGEIVNQVYVDPVQSGCVVNLYYTRSIPAGSPTGTTHDDVIYPIDTGGFVNAEQSGESRGLTLGSGTPAWVDFNLDDVGGVTTELWMGREYTLGEVMGLAVAPNGTYLDAISLDSGVMTVQHGVFSTAGPVYSYYVDITQGGTTTRLAWPEGVIPQRGSRLRLFVRFGSSPMILGQINEQTIYDSRAPVNLIVAGLTNTLAVPIFGAGSIERFGSSVTWDSFARLTSAVNGYGDGPMEAYFEDPDRYTLIPISGSNTDTNGTFLRFHPSYVGWTEGEGLALGFVGGISDRWSEAEWTPIGQFVLTKGTLSFSDVYAVAIKMEFTSLIAEPYDPFIPINTSVARLASSGPETQGASMSDSDRASILVNSANRFGGIVRGVSVGQDSLVNYVSPTTAVAVIDGTVRDQLAARLGFGYNMAQWQGAGRADIQSPVGQHSYVMTEVQSISRVSFFVGLRTVVMQRKIDRALGDGSAYDDTLLGSSNIDVPNTTLNIEPGQMYTPVSDASSVMFTPLVGVSLPYFSRRPVRGMQFSTQQTGPSQLVPDDEFRDPGLISYDFSNPTSWHTSGDAIIFWDQGAVRVSRNPSVLDAFYAPDTPIIHPPVSPVLASGFARTVTLDFDSFGGISSPSVSVSPRGVLYVGCRVAAWNKLSGPLALRIYGSDETTVLAEVLFTPQVNVPTEMILPYVINNTSLDRIVQVRVEQTGPYMDSWMMYALSAFDTSVLWEFSVDDGATWIPAHTTRGLKYGVVIFPYPGSALRWRVTAYRYNCVIDAVRLRPWYLDRLGSEL